MKKLLFPLSMIAVLSIAFVALAKGPGGGGSGPGAGGGSTTLDAAEETHLKFMRAEEKLAHDVYYTLGLEFPDLAVFSNIVSSEQNHQDTMVEKLEQYGLPDPNAADVTISAHLLEKITGHILPKNIVLWSTSLMM